VSACRADSVKEVPTCKAPIRLMLRAISEGDDPQANQKTPAPSNVEQKVNAIEDARAHRYAAQEKSRARDGKGCLDELDKSDQLDPRPHMLSTYPEHAWMRAECLMMAGQCDAGKRLMRIHHEAKKTPASEADAIIKSASDSLCPKK
jgi:hypothetical protein